MPDTVLLLVKPSARRKRCFDVHLASGDGFFQIPAAAFRNFEDFATELALLCLLLAVNGSEGCTQAAIRAELRVRRTQSLSDTLASEIEDAHASEDEATVGGTRLIVKAVK